MTASPITRVYIAACRRDFFLARICVASVRHWHPDIPITLLVDENVGRVDSSGLERDWNVSRFTSRVRKFGLGHSKLEPLFLPGRERYLVIDSDTVLTGPVLDRFNATPGDFIVHPEYENPHDLERVIFALAPLAQFDPTFGRHRLAFNTGHYVGTSGILRREDFDRVLEWTEPRKVRRPEIFKCGDQGVLNYVLLKAEKENRAVINTLNFHLYVRRDTSAVTVKGIIARTSPAFIVHWAGISPETICGAEREDLLRFYDRYYRARRSRRSRGIDWREENTPAKWLRRGWRSFQRLALWLAGAPEEVGGEAWSFAARDLHQFYSLERSGYHTWQWAQPEAGIRLKAKRGASRVRIETGSPDPMENLGAMNIRFFINGKQIPPERITIEVGVAEFDVDASELESASLQYLSWTMDPLPVEGDKRKLGMPVSGVWIYRQRGLPLVASAGLRAWMRRRSASRKQRAARWAGW